MVGRHRVVEAVHAVGQAPSVRRRQDQGSARAQDARPLGQRPLGARDVLEDLAGQDRVELVGPKREIDHVADQPVVLREALDALLHDADRQVAAGHLVVPLAPQPLEEDVLGEEAVAGGDVEHATAGRNVLGEQAADVGEPRGVEGQHERRRRARRDVGGGLVDVLSVAVEGVQVGLVQLDVADLDDPVVRAPDDKLDVVGRLEHVAGVDPGRPRRELDAVEGGLDRAGTDLGEIEPNAQLAGPTAKIVLPPAEVAVGMDLHEGVDVDDQVAAGQAAQIERGGEIGPAVAKGQRVDVWTYAQIGTSWAWSECLTNPTVRAPAPARRRADPGPARA